MEGFDHSGHRFLGGAVSGFFEQRFLMLQLHAVGYATFQPVENPLRSTVALIPEKPCDFSGATDGLDDFCVVHTSIKHHVYRFVNAMFLRLLIASCQGLPLPLCFFEYF